MEEEDASSKNKKKKKKKHGEEDDEGKASIEQLFDVLMTATDRMEEQRMSPPHHVIKVVSPPQSEHSPSHSLSDQLDSIRPLSADSMSRSSEHGGLSGGGRKTHPRISNLLETHTLPRMRSRSEDNVYLTALSGHADLPRPTSEASFHHHHVSTSSDALSDSIGGLSSTDSMTNSFNSNQILDLDTNKPTIEQLTIEQPSMDLLTIGQPSKADSNGTRTPDRSGISPQTRRMSRSYQVLYSASLGYCTSLPSRKNSMPLTSSNGIYPIPHQFSTTLQEWSMDTSVEM